MSKHLALWAFGLLLLPGFASAQSQCPIPELPDTEVGGWYQSESGNTVVGRARYRLVSTATEQGTATLGIAFSHRSDDESHATAAPSVGELPALMTASLQIRHTPQAGGTSRRWSADAVDVLLDGKRFPGQLNIDDPQDGIRPVVIGWEVWFGDEDLFAAMETARQMEVRLRNIATGSQAAFRFDLSSFKGVRARLVQYWRCTAAPHHEHPH